MSRIDQTNRIVSIDYIRAICMIWIIGFWHLSEYCDLSIADSHWAINVTTGVLATFTFVSGYFLGDKKTNNKQDIAQFYKSRVIRIYPSFFLSCASLYVLNIMNPKIGYIHGFKQFITTLLGLTCFFEPTAYTVWFMSMLIFFYAITPLINSAQKFLNKIVIMALLVATTIVLEITIGISDGILFYMPVYFAGLLAAPHKVEISRLGLKTNAILCSLGLIVWFTCNRWSEIMDVRMRNLIMLNFTISISSILILFVFGRLLDGIINKDGILGSILKGISYGSFMAYLFHRQILGAIYLVTGEFPTWVALAVILPLVLAISYAAQRVYDYLTRNWMKPRRAES